MTIINKKKVIRNVVYKKTFVSYLPYLLTYTKREEIKCNHITK